MVSKANPFALSLPRRLAKSSVRGARENSRFSSMGLGRGPGSKGAWDADDDGERGGSESRGREGVFLLHGLPVAEVGAGFLQAYVVEQPGRVSGARFPGVAVPSQEGRVALANAPGAFMHTSGAADGPGGALDVQAEGRFEKGLLRRGWSEGHWALGEWRIRRRASQVGRATARTRVRQRTAATG